jgi:hypothetical protein
MNPFPNEQSSSLKARTAGKQAQGQNSAAVIPWQLPVRASCPEQTLRGISTGGCV